MEWLRTHPYLSSICGAGALLVIGILVVERRANTPRATSPTAWGGGAVYLLDQSSFEPQKTGDAYIGSSANDDRPVSLPPLGGFVSPTPGSDSNPYDFENLISQLISQSKPKSVGNTDASVLDAYAYIPRGIISTTTLHTRTDLQQKLYDYGNDVGSSIESFEQQHSNMVQILKEQAEDRTDPNKAAAVMALGRAFQTLGNGLLSADNVPPTALSAHQALAQSYIELGKNLALIPSAERDSDFIAAIQTYNASADAFTRSYIQLVSLFGTYGVTFASTESGKVFAFAPASF